MILIRKIRNFIRRAIGLPPRLIAENLLGHNLLLREGTIRKEPDYDDAWVLACLHHTEVFFDVGANVGFDAILGAGFCQNIKEIVLIEANLEALSIAFDNLIRNRLSAKARFVLAFASDLSDKKMKFWTMASGAAGSMFKSHAKSAAKAGSYMEVSTMTLDEISRAYSLIPDFVKIDVEGAETFVLGGAKYIAEFKKTRFLIEMHSNPELTMEENARRVLDWCQRFSYRAWYLDQTSLLETSGQIKSRGRCHLLLQPSDWPYPDWLKGIKQSDKLNRGVGYQL